MWILIVFSHCVCALGDALDTISPRRSQNIQESDFLNKSARTEIPSVTRFSLFFKRVFSSLVYELNMTKKSLITISIAEPLSKFMPADLHFRNGPLNIYAYKLINKRPARTQREASGSRLKEENWHRL